MFYLPTSAYMYLNNTKYNQKFERFRSKKCQIQCKLILHLILNVVVSCLHHRNKIIKIENAKHFLKKCKDIKAEYAKT